MTPGNSVLCAIVGAPIDGGDYSLEVGAADPNAAVLPLALSLARTGSIDEFRRLCRARGDMPFGLLAACCLFIGLTEDVIRARALFEVLRAAAPLDPGVWWASARFQAACGDDAAALRSAAIHAELTGTPLTTPSREDATPSGAAHGAIRILRGDVNIDL